MTAMENIVVVGNGIAGSTAASTLREHGYRGRITIIGAEMHAPYSRPALSKAALLDTGEIDSHLLPPAEHDAHALLGIAATGLDLAKRRLKLSDASTLGFDGLIIASGIRPRKLRPDLPHERTFRNLEDAQGLRILLRSRPRVAVIGAGVLGMELASACAAAGSRVTVICRGKPMHSSLGPFLADVMASAAVRQGVSILHPHAVDLRDSASERGACDVVLADGSTVTADLVISAIGDVPNTEWLAHSGLLTDGELRVDSRGRLAPGVVAAGDVAAIPGANGHGRVPLWTSAIAQAKVAAQALLFGDAAPELVYEQYFWTEQFGLALKACGPLPVRDEPDYLEGNPGTEPTLIRWQNADGSGTAVSINYRMSIVKLRALGRASLSTPCIAPVNSSPR
jgi:3-phenylpropionate/trans-cinnamate dioxygenase ferredoxin reductase subunit